MVRDTSRVVGTNVSRLRSGAGLTARALAERATTLGTPLSQSGISDIEHGRRGVSVDQLTVLAAALDVSPLTLLMPYSDAGDLEPATLTGVEAETGRLMVDWLRGDAPISVGWDAHDIEAFRRRSLPQWAWVSAPHRGRVWSAPR